MITATELIRRATVVRRAGREALFREVLMARDVPSFCLPAAFCEIVFMGTSKDLARHALTLRVAPDYLGAGTAEDWVRLPIRAATAQLVADAWGCVLPTPALVDRIWRASRKLEPQPQKPGPWMDMAWYFARHQAKIEAQRAVKAFALGELLAGHKKDVVVSAARRADKVAIYGWHKADGRPIQSLYTQHGVDWCDYSHGIRLIDDRCVLDGAPDSVRRIMADPVLCALVSDEGPIGADRRYVR